MNIFWWIVILDIILISVFFSIGYYAKEKEHKDIWGKAEVMEIRKSRCKRKEWEKKHPILNFFQGFYYEIKRKKDIPEDTYDNIKYFIQRGQKGYSKRDVWGFNFYLTNVMLKGLKELQEMVHGYPIALQTSEDSEGEEEIQKWKNIIGDIIWTFEAIEKIEDHNWMPVWKEKNRKEIREKVKQLNEPDDNPLFPELPQKKYYLMTRKEMIKYRKGWRLLQEHFFSLWD